MTNEPTLVERIRFEGHMASRAGQLQKLEALADEVAELIATLARARACVPAWESMAGPANSVYEQCARDLRAALDAS